MLEPPFTVSPQTAAELHSEIALLRCVVFPCYGCDFLISTAPLVLIGRSLVTYTEPGTTLALSNEINPWIEPPWNQQY